MPSLNFHERFVEAVESGRKRQSIRRRWKDGRFPFHPGQRLYLYTGLRTRAARKLGEGIIRRVEPVLIRQPGPVLVNGRILDDCHVEALARNDGFRDFEQMMRWWRATHDLPFEGFIVYWDPAAEERIH